MTMVVFQTCEGEGSNMGILPVSQLIINNKSRCAVKQIHLVVARKRGGRKFIGVDGRVHLAEGGRYPILSCLLHPIQGTVYSKSGVVQCLV